MTTESTTDRLQCLRAQVHPDCVVCSPSKLNGIRMRFEVRPEGGVHAAFYCDGSLEGYAGCLHGGIVSSLLDGAMANCMFSQGLALMTAELRVRFLHSVHTGRFATVHAWVRNSSPLLYVLEAKIVQQEVVKATAVGKFMHSAEVVEMPSEELPSS